ncbi:MAG: biotin/lipoyl-binding protein [Betaproteobacteria bacterium]|nr:biotin/lipoyl-binding protein [Betaproteobacteria bacterium]
MLIANRAEVVARIARSARALGIRTVAVCSDADRDAPFTAHCDQVVCIGGERPSDSYLRTDKLLDAARASGAQAIHPGYGFLSENAAFAQAVVDAGLVWVGPSPEAIAAMGDKASARRRMQDAGVPVLPGTPEASDDLAALQAQAQALGLPLMVKAAAGGGGRGMRLVQQAQDLPAALQGAHAEALAAFGDGRLLLERALLAPRHVEVQVLADGHGHLLHLGERDCSVQRRHQKLIEEAPSPAVDAQLRRRMGEAAVQVARAASAQGYVGLGTVEFLLDADGHFWFMEMNTRLQVEHPVTESLTGLDLVAWSLRIAMGARLDLSQDEVLQRFETGGHAIEARLCAEDPAHNHLPQSGTLLHWQPPAQLRVDAALRSGQTISPFYDSMLGKLIAHGPDRRSAVQQLITGLAQTEATGVPTNRAFLARVLAHPAFARGEVSTAFLARHFGDAAQVQPPVPPVLQALAAVALAAVPAQALPPLWQGWTSAALTVQQVSMLIGGERQTWTLQGQGRQWRAVCDGHCLVFEDVHSDGGHGVQATVDGAPLRARWHRQGTQFWLQAGLHELQGEDLRLQAASRQQGPSSGAVLAPMHGRLLRIEVEAGQRVEAGQILFVMEAMKMEHRLLAPCAGRVSQLQVSVGEQVAARRLLAQIEALA